MQIDIAIFQIIILVFSAIIHEYMHGWMAERLGDRTARDAGRLTLNPIPHIDPIGSVLLPFILAFTGAGFVFGWAKPVPFNPYNLRDQKYGAAKVAAAGPLGNFIVALSLGLIARFLFPEAVVTPLFAGFIYLVIFINLLLMVFNLVPIPPMDGSKILAAFLPAAWQIKFAELERYGLVLVLLFVWFGFGTIMPVIDFLFTIITGVAFF